MQYDHDGITLAGEVWHVRRTNLGMHVQIVDPKDPSTTHTYTNYEGHGWAHDWVNTYGNVVGGEGFISPTAGRVLDAIAAAHVR